ncbi:SNF2-related protein [Actinomadura sp. DC4]|uniref:SNF2-related protein n=1 Tax=Actinomadura sp. DC4 TaxID=3055069 RepID=UPI0025AF2BA4|nr:SNF2-related protein [Actinomadura sp. DC4]MDN3356868.1 SNF2-related protein [Actinomadura sp. DC4]
MLVAHAIWHGGALCLWAEDPALPATTRVRTTPRPHPFAAPDLTGTSYAAPTAGAMRVQLTLLLPGTAGGPFPSPELAREPSSRQPEACPWLVPALALDPFAAMALLASADDTDDVVRGADLRFFALVADEAMHLAGRGRVLPALVREDGDLTARWRPVITGADTDRFGDLARAMPPACRAADGGRPAAEVLLEALTGLTDAAVRGIVPHPLLAERTGRVPERLPLAERWAAALTGPDPAVAREPGDDPDTLAAALDDWAAAARRPSGPLRVCFRLAEPPENDPGGPWTVQFALQGTDDPSLYVPAAAIWTGEVTSVADAEETLLAGLGRALRLYPEIAEALRVATPTSVTTDSAGAFRFLREAAPLLSAAGFGVQLPQWAGRAKLGMKLTTRTATAESGATVSSGFGLDDLVDFRWDLAVEGEDITEEELAELARLKAPLVRLRGMWVELDDAQLRAALEFLSRGRTGEMTAAQAVRAAIHAGDDTLPLLQIDADGALGDLLSGEADRRLEPIPTPEGFEGTLRPYQERGLAWLSFLDGLGLGAVLADDMGLGKCVAPETPVLVNGAHAAAEDVWARYAGAPESDGEGEWASPAATLTTDSLDATGRVVPARISRLYRQHVSEPLRRITLSDGASVTVSRRHRLLGPDGWTNRVLPGDRVRVPGRAGVGQPAKHMRLDTPADDRQEPYATVVSVEDVGHTGWIYDFEVPEHHNYVAAGMFCHNTAQTLALLATRREGGPTLLIGPMSLVGNWQREAARFTPKLRVYVHHGGGRHRGEELERAVRAADLVLTTYGTASRDVEALSAIAWDRVVCDEAQALKNSGTRQAQAVRSIPARGRIALTGTPVENHLTELWSIMEFANPGLLGPRQAFRERFATPIEAHGDEEAAATLGRATGPFILRRLKTDKTIITDLPEKQEIKVWCNLTPEQASLYQATVEDMLDRISASSGMERRGLVLATMAKLKQVCNHPAHLLKDGSRLPGRSGKLERLEEICAEVVEQGEKALVFTQYSEFGTMLQPHLEARLARPVLWLHGGTTKRRRDELVRRFQEDSEPAVFLLSLKAAGTGLTLTAANHVVHVDRWWNPAVEDQATDRAFRIGQTKNVQVRKFICVGTMEERVDEMIERKKSLAERVVGTGEGWLTELSVAELRDVVRLGSEAVSA